MNNAHFETCKQAIDILPSGLHSYWLDGIYRGKLDVIVGLLLLRLTGLTSIEVRLRDASTIGSTVFDALSSRLGSCAHYYRYPNINSITLSLDRWDGKLAWEVGDDDEGDIFDTYHPVPSMLEFTKLEYVQPLNHCVY